jgi:hypothetical protein
MERIMKSIKILIAMILLLIPLSAYSFCGALMSISPCIDAGTDEIEGIETMSSYNGLPRTGKYPGDMPDIGAWEWFPGVDCEHPLGDWSGVPLDYNPREILPTPQAPSNLRTQ